MHPVTVILWGSSYKPILNAKGIFLSLSKAFFHHMLSFFLIPVLYFSGPTFNRSPAKKAVDAIGSKPIPSFCSKMVWVPTITFFNLTNYQQLYCVWATRVTRQIKNIGTEGRRNCSNWATFILEENQSNQNSCKDRLWQPQGADLTTRWKHDTAFVWNLATAVKQNTNQNSI